MGFTHDSMVLMFSSKIDDHAVSLTEAFHYIDETPTRIHSPDAFIGFVNENEEVIQFLRYTNDDWLFDIPLQDSKSRKWNNQLLQLENISTTVVKRIVELFFVDLDLIFKINTKFRIIDSLHIEDGINYFQIHRTFLEWIERQQSREFYS